MLLLLLSCAPAPCRDHCDDFGAFFRACANDDGILECDRTDMEFTCTDDVSAYVDCIEGIGEDCGPDDGVFHACTSGAEVAASCRAVANELWRRLETEEERDERLEECKEDDEFDAAIRDKDCAKVCELLGA